jgi:hypothetical protein
MPFFTGMITVIGGVPESLMLTITGWCLREG